MQAFIYRHLVPSEELAVTVNGAPRLFMGDAFKIISTTPVKIAPGGTARVRISTPSPAFVERFSLKLDNAPEGISLANVSAVQNGVELVLGCDAGKVKPGASGNLICSVLPRNPGQVQNPNRPGNQRRDSGATLPAIPFEVVTAEHQ